jgi:protein tyrosine phosphatase
MEMDQLVQPNHQQLNNRQAIKNRAEDRAEQITQALRKKRMELQRKYKTSSFNE